MLVWLFFVNVMKNFPENIKARNYDDVVGNMRSAFHHFKYKMSIKMHFLFSHLDDFSDNLDAISDEHGDRFLLHLMELEERYQIEVIAI